MVNYKSLIIVILGGIKVKKVGEGVFKGTGLILFLILIFISVYPFVWMVLNSFRTNEELYLNTFALPRSWDFSIFPFVLGRGGMLIAAKNSAIITIIVVFLTVFACSLASFAFSHLRFRGSSTLFKLYIGMQVVSGQVVLISLFRVLHILNLFNSRIGVSLVMVAFGTPVTVYLFYNSFKSISHEIRESTQIDGCSNFRFYSQILMPLSRPVIATVVIFTTLGAWNEYLFALTFLRSMELRTLTVRIAAFMGQFGSGFDTSFAVLSLSVIPVLLVFLFMQRHFIKGLTSGAIKG